MISKRELQSRISMLEHQVETLIDLVTGEKYRGSLRGFDSRGMGLTHKVQALADHHGLEFKLQMQPLPTPPPRVKAVKKPRSRKK